MTQEDFYKTLVPTDEMTNIRKELISELVALHKTYVPKEAGADRQFMFLNALLHLAAVCTANVAAKSPDYIEGIVHIPKLAVDKYFNLVLEHSVHQVFGSSKK